MQKPQTAKHSLFDDEQKLQSAIELETQIQTDAPQFEGGYKGTTYSS